MAVVETDSFLQIDADRLIEILNSNAIAVESEGDVFNVIAQWIGFNAEQRRKEFERLFATIRMSQISYTVNGSLKFIAHNLELIFFFVLVFHGARSEIFNRRWPQRTVSHSMETISNEQRKTIRRKPTNLQKLSLRH